MRSSQPALQALIPGQAPQATEKSCLTFSTKKENENVLIIILIMYMKNISDILYGYLKAAIPLMVPLYAFCTISMLITCL